MLNAKRDGPSSAASENANWLCHSGQVPPKTWKQNYQKSQPHTHVWTQGLWVNIHTCICMFSFTAAVFTVTSYKTNLHTHQLIQEKESVMELNSAIKKMKSQHFQKNRQNWTSSCYQNRQDTNTLCFSDTWNHLDLSLYTYICICTCTAHESREGPGDGEENSWKGQEGRRVQKTCGMKAKRHSGKQGRTHRRGCGRGQTRTQQMCEIAVDVWKYCNSALFRVT